ncbi:MAG: threonine--tRNA ligase, partial [Deltaproteobacteria bacterium]
MKKIEVTFSDGSHQAFPSGVVGLEVVKKFPVKEAIALKIDNAKIIDLMTPIEKDCHVRILTPTDRDALEVLRHSTAHIMSEAVQKLFPGAKVTIGPATEQGFYYDYDFEPGFTPEDLNKIEKKMSEIIESKSPFQRTTIDKKEALKKFRAMKEDYKVEILNQIPEEKVSLYKHGKWEDLCRGPHLPHTGWVKAFKLLSIAGAYWRGNVKNKMLQRIYGTCFETKEE